MSIVIIVNIVTSLGIMLGGLGMKRYSKSHEDYSIGFRTQRAMSSEDAWCFANKKCGGLWIVIGLISFILTIAAIFIFQFESIAQVIILIFTMAAAIVSAIVVENQLKIKYSNNN